LVGAKVSKNHKVQKESIERVLGKYNASIKIIPNTNKNAGMKNVLVVKKVLGKL
jgi:hypothetical protein